MRAWFFTYPLERAMPPCELNGTARKKRFLQSIKANIPYFDRAEMKLWWAGQDLFEEKQELGASLI